MSSCCGEIIRRPLSSVVMQIHEPSPACADQSNSALKPGDNVRSSGAVAFTVFITSPHGGTPNFPRLVALTQSVPGEHFSACQSFSSRSLVFQLVSVTIKRFLAFGILI